MSVTLIGSTTLSSSNTSISFTSIPTGYKNYILRWSVFSNSTSDDSPWILINSDVNAYQINGPGWNFGGSFAYRRGYTGPNDAAHDPDWGEWRLLSAEDTNLYAGGLGNTLNLNEANWQTIESVTGMFQHEQDQAKYPVSTLTIEASSGTMLAGSTVSLWGES